MIEEEARKKWCPMGRAACKSNEGISGITPNLQMETVGSEYKITPLTCCLASDCMMWRWSYLPDEALGNERGPQGFCGLAGERA